ncbi:MAG: hypothetical protein Q8N35_11395 [Methylococcaceae bacterium]|nr:hypothetical protein [Methylococcaceae bacterium]MDZ4156608.1 hypothetical protein [Methylococcales bacterium]MDP2394758.1 hypothetical protein [Methylococcaceae bacterium]MDP3020179.1 hypothetical protein [Methylococcaceae bacterium]MDP3390720.1 hypothetical protein [Methylococcaceae bacterium]
MQTFYKVGLIWVSVAFLLPTNAFAINDWSYVQEKDRLTNRNYSVVISPLPRRDLYDNMRLEVMCKDNALQVTVESTSLITSQGSRFDVEYQIDQKPPVKLPMTAYKDSKRRGFNTEQAQAIVADMLSGQAIFLRVNTLIRKVLLASIPLDDAAKSLTQVLTDCGIAASANSIVEKPYSLEAFQQDFAKLNEEQQQQLLDKIRKLLIEMH